MTLARRRRPVRENVPEVAATARADLFHADHSIALDVEVPADFLAERDDRPPQGREPVPGTPPSALTTGR